MGIGDVTLPAWGLLAAFMRNHAERLLAAAEELEASHQADPEGRR